jgi:DtxR family Mn-dependent transcriptional regulator
MRDDTGLTQSESVENFVKAVYHLQQRMERVSTKALAQLLEISAPSVTDMAQRLMAAGLVDYRKHRGVVLTPSGEEVALKVIRRHRLVELYLVEELGYAPYEVHEEAERLEHAVSDRFVEEIARRLGDPAVDPHGDPIPAANGTIISRDLKPLTELPTHMIARVSRFETSSSEMLRHILDRGFSLNARVEVLARDPFDGPITVLIDGQERVIGHNVAASILLEVHNGEEDPK